MIIFKQIAKQFFATNALTRFLEPVKITPYEAKEIPKLYLKSEKYLVQNWWSEKPFILPDEEPMKIPIFSFTDGSYLQKTIQIPQQIFNCPLRRDLVYRLYNYRINLDKFRTKMTRNRAMTHGSGRKMRPQKGQGKARMGDKRAPHLRKGGKAHGAKPKVYSYPLNAKIKLNALKALLTGKLVEGKIKIVDSEVLTDAKTKILGKIIQKHSVDQRTLFCIITSKDYDENFERAQRNIKQIMWHDTYSLDVMSLFRADKIIITLKGLEQMLENLNKTYYVIYRQSHMPKLQALQQKKKQQEQPQFDPSQPYEFKFKILAQYMDLYEKLKKQNPQFIQKQRQRIRKVIV